MFFRRLRPTLKQSTETREDVHHTTRHFSAEGGFTIAQASGFARVQSWLPLRGATSQDLLHLFDLFFVLLP